MAEVIQIGESGGSNAEQKLPHNVEAEAALLGALMIDNRLVEDVQMKLRAHHFYEPLHGRIYDQILKLTDKNMVANPVTLKPLFEADEPMKEVGGPAYLAKLTGSGASVIGAKDFAAQVYDLALLRSLVGVGRELVEGAMDTSEDVAPLDQIERAETELYRVAEEGGAEGKAKSFSEATKLALEMAEKALNFGGKLSGLTSGIEGINGKTGGLQRSDLVILAGRPGMGKSSLAMNIAFSCAQRFVRDQQDGIPPEKAAGAPVAFFSLEMSADQLATRVLAAESGISSEKLRMGKIGRDEFQNLARASAELSNLPLYIDDTAGLSIAALRTRARRLKRQKGIGMVVVDYLQLLSGTGRSSESNRVQEISEISRGLKQLAKELDCPVIALSQLSRAVEQREDKRPQLSDLRESGSIEQDADMVWFVYRGDYYLEMRKPEDDHPEFVEWQEEMNRLYGLAELIVAKQRHGSTGKVMMKFDRTVTRFTDVVDESYYAEPRG
ncbi:replicative DNA helicase [Sphingomicrobium clamense]|uniref:Replicative DNA helicase n=1 Tax=Sphingomicrobium clamense TaxID=2851013 RepID=A0ABS6V7N4_9SPHN|nr:replicative DNA helicase [Sphingomicrobium sp. B8]MBW0145561.1 replicative DNA helicase [Sphingomicrobium sp. B8]